MKKLIVLIVLIVVLMSGCVGEEAKPVKYEDEYVSFNYLDSWELVKPPAALVALGIGSTSISISLEEGALDSVVEDAKSLLFMYEVEELSRKDITINGMPGKEVVLELAPEDIFDESVSKMKLIVLSRGDKVYKIEYLSSEDSFEKDLPHLTAVLDSLEFK